MSPQASGVRLLELTSRPNHCGARISICWWASSARRSASLPRAAWSGMVRAD